MATIISYPNNFINQTISIPTSLDSKEIVTYLNVNVSDALTDEYIEITHNSEVITLLITEECRYTPIDIHFINKNGAQQVVTFFKAKTDSISITDESYEGNGQPIDFNHQFNRYNIQATKKFNVNSGFVSEDLNDTYTELLLSTKVWLYDDVTKLYTPLNVASKSFEYKTRQKDRLINYKINFDYAFNEINTI